MKEEEQAPLKQATRVSRQGLTLPVAKSDTTYVDFLSGQALDAGGPEPEPPPGELSSQAQAPTNKARYEQKSERQAILEERKERDTQKSKRKSQTARASVSGTPDRKRLTVADDSSPTDEGSPPVSGESPDRHNKRASTTKGPGFLQRMQTAHVVGMNDKDQMMLEELDEELRWRQNHRYPNLLYVVDHSLFESALCFIVIFNCMTIGISTDQPTSALGLDVAEQIFTVIFTMEIVMRSLVYGFFKYYFASGWSAADLALVVVTGPLLTWVLEPLGEDGSVVRSLQVLRAARLCRVVRVIRRMPQLREGFILIQGLVDCTNHIAWVACMILFCLYIFAVFCTALIGQSEAYCGPYSRTCPVDVEGDVQDLFRNVSVSMLTLFQIMLLDRGFMIMRQVMETQPWTWIIWVSFLIIGCVAMMRLVTAIIVQGSFELSQQDEAVRLKEMRKEKERMLKDLSRLFLKFDKDQGGTISKGEFEAAFNDTEIKNKMNMLGLARCDMDDVFGALDCDASGEVDIDEFVNGLTHLRGGALNRDVLFINRKIKDLFKQVVQLDEEVSEKQRVATEHNGWVSQVLEDIKLVNELLPLRGESHFRMRREMLQRVYQNNGTLPPEIDDVEMCVPLHEIEDRPDICLTSRGSGRLVKLPIFLKRAILANDGQEEKEEDPAQVLEHLEAKVAVTNIIVVMLTKALNDAGVDLHRNFTKAGFQDAARRVQFPGNLAPRIHTLTDMDQDGKVTFLDVIHGCVVALEGTGPGSLINDPLLVKWKYAVIKNTLQGNHAKKQERVTRESFSSALAKVGVSTQVAGTAFDQLCRTHEHDSALQAASGQVTEAKGEGLHVLTACSILSMHTTVISWEAVSSMKKRILRHSFTLLAADEDPRVLRKSSKQRKGQEVTLQLNEVQFQRVLLRCGVPRDSAKRLFTTLDADCSQTVDVEEFCKASQLADPSNHDIFGAVRALLFGVFQKMDVDSNRDLELHEFVGFLQNAGVKPMVAVHSFLLFDVDHNNKLSISEFLKGMTEDVIAQVMHATASIRLLLYAHGFEQLTGRSTSDEIDKDQLVPTLVEAGVSLPQATRIFEIVGDSVLSTSKIRLGLFCQAIASETFDAVEAELNQLKFNCVAAAFKSLDLDMSGTVSAQEFARGMSKLGAKPREAHRFFAEANGAGQAEMSVHTLLRALAIEVQAMAPRALLKIRELMATRLFDDVRKAVTSMTQTSIFDLNESDFVTAMIKFGCHRDDASLVFRAITDNLMSCHDFAHSMAVDSLASSGSDEVRTSWQKVKSELYLQLFRLIDVSADGGISEAEMERFCARIGASGADALELFKWIDTNKSGVISRNEFTSALLN